MIDRQMGEDSALLLGRGCWKVVMVVYISVRGVISENERMQEEEGKLWLKPRM